MIINRTNMKKIIYCILICAFYTLPLVAQIPIERVYISTDKDSYVAGEKVWMSGFCFKKEGGEITLSDISSLAYIEIFAVDKPVVTIKMAINKGRGSAWADLPFSLATGNYKLVAYTHFMQNEDPLPYFEKTISIFNTISSERLPNVAVGINDSSYVQEIGTSDQKRESNLVISFSSSDVFSTESNCEFSISNTNLNPVSVSVSIFKSSPLPEYNNRDFKEFISTAFSNNGDNLSLKFIPEYEGEIIKGKIIPVNPSQKNDISGHSVFISFPGRNGELYSSKSGANGEVEFFTDNVYGQRECVLEVVAKDTTQKYTVELMDPFLHPKITPAEKLILLPVYEKSLQERSIGMQLSRRYAADSLFTSSEPLHNPLFSDKKKRYMLDDYTRFPVMEEVIIEYVYELKTRKTNNGAQLLVRWENDLNSNEYAREHTLALVDGIPVFDHKKILDLDPLKIKSLEIFGDKYFIGNLSYTGIASFNTYTSDYSGLKFDKSVRIIDFEGAKPYSVMNGKEFENIKYPDFRSTILWEPIINIPASSVKKQLFRTSLIAGTYKIVVQGTTDTGEPLFAEKYFEVK